MDRTLSTIEKMLGGEFSSDPRCSRFPLPLIPPETPDGISYTHSGYIVTPEMAKDWVLHRSIRRDLMPRTMIHDNVVPNRKYLISYVKDIARRLQRPGWWNRGIHQGAAFTPDGFILDAQHRFAACALSGVPIIFPVAVNVPWSAFKDIDQNRHRTAHQMLDIPYATAAASVARHLIPVLEGDSETTVSRTGRDHNEQVIEICLGWPYFAEDQSWMKEIYEAGSETGIPTGPLGSACIGALASGVGPDEVQQFLNGLRPLSRDVKYLTIGTNGDDPRRLLARFFKKQRDSRGSGRQSISAAEQRSNAAVIRYAMDVWLKRNSDKPKKIRVMQRWPETNDLPRLWDESAIRRFHNQYVN
jgi:hypothetical protein